jgi:hypothetical protein
MMCNLDKKKVGTNIKILSFLIICLPIIASEIYGLSYSDRDLLTVPTIRINESRPNSIDILKDSEGNNQTDNETSDNCTSLVYGMEISKNPTYICPEVYYLNNSNDSNYAIHINSGVTVYGGGAIIIGNGIGYGVSLNHSTNVRLMNLTVSNYRYNYFLFYSYRTVLMNVISQFGEYGIWDYGYSSNSLLLNSRIENYSIMGLTIGSYWIKYASTNFSVIGNNFGVYNHSYLYRFDPQIEISTSNAKISGNIIKNNDKGLWCRYCLNVSVDSNQIDNSTQDTDSYDTGILFFPLSINNSIWNNTILHSGTTGILMQKGGSGNSIFNNSIGIYPIQTKRLTNDTDHNEPPTGIYIGRLYKRYLSDSSENISDDITKINGYSMNDTQIFNNTFDSNVAIFVRLMGGNNISVDLEGINYSYYNVQFPTHFEPNQSFYVNSNYTNVSHLSDSRVISTVLSQDHCFLSPYWGCNYLINYQLVNNTLWLQNRNNTITYNASLIFPNNLFYGVINVIEANCINVSLPTNMQWYHTINFSVTPSSGIVRVFVSNYSQDYVKWNVSSVEGSGSLSYVICNLRNSSVYDLKSSGTRLLGILSSPSGCVSYSNSIRDGSFDLRFNATGLVGGQADLSVISADISLSSSAVVENEEVNITARIYNSGGIPAYGVSVKCFDGFPSQNVLIGVAYMNLSNGSHSYAVFHWTAYPKWTHGIYVVVDQANAIDESNENNNIAYKNIYVRTPADLSISSSDISFFPTVLRDGSGALISALVRNLGEAAASFVFRLIDGVMSIAERSITLDGETSVIVSVPWNVSVVGSHDLSMSLDPANKVVEQREDNNLAVKTLIVQQSTTSVPSTTSLFFGTTTLGSPTTTLYSPGSCVMPGNALPCNEVTLAEVVSGISVWAEGAMQINDVVALINSWANQTAYPPV